LAGTITADLERIRPFAAAQAIARHRATPNRAGPTPAYNVTLPNAGQWRL
jgi:hypothetical protein